MGDIQELWGVIRMGFLEEEVCKLSQEMKIRRHKNHRIKKQVMRHSLTSLVTWESHGKSHELPLHPPEELQ